MQKQKLQELIEEFKTVTSGKNRLADVVLPALVFLLVNFGWGLEIAIWAALAVGTGILFLRLIKKDPVLSALTGIGGLAAAVLFTVIINRASAFFLPGILSSALIALLAFFSILLKRPLVAWTSLSLVAGRWIGTGIPEFFLPILRLLLSGRFISALRQPYNISFLTGKQPLNWAFSRYSAAGLL